MTKQTLKDLPLTAPPQFKVARWITIDEAIHLYNILMEEEVKHYFESGTANGYSTCWAALTDVISIHTFDLYDRPKVWDLPQIYLKGGVKFINQDFADSISSYADKVNGRRLFFIDGDHSKKGFARDWQAVEAILKPTDLVLFHDVYGAYRHITKKCERLAKEHKVEFIRTERGMALLYWG